MIKGNFQEWKIRRSKGRLMTDWVKVIRDLREYEKSKLVILSSFGGVMELSEKDLLELLGSGIEF